MNLLCLRKDVKLQTSLKQGLQGTRIESTEMEGNLTLKRSLHRLLLICVKYLPILISFFYLLNVVLYCCGVDTCVISIISGTSILTLVFMYICSALFKFCFYHRMFIHYILLNNVLNITLDVLCVSEDVTKVLTYNLILLGFCLFLIIYSYVKHNKNTVGENNQ